MGMNRQPKKIANDIIDFGLDYALKNQDDPRKRAKAYRRIAEEFLTLASQMEYELDANWSDELNVY
jgi:hypothetical protein